MARNKTAKRIAKRNATKKSSATTQKIEKDFIGVPAKLVVKTNKEVTALEQKETKLKKALHKAKAQVKAWETRIKAAAKAKSSATAKKQLAAAKKAHAQTVKMQAGLNKESAQIAQMLELAYNKQAKLNAISKLLNQFEKEWARNSKKAKAASKAKAKSKKSAAKVKAKNKPQAETIEIVEQPHFESLDMTTSASEVRFDDASDLTS